MTLPSGLPEHGRGPSSAKPVFTDDHRRALLGCYRHDTEPRLSRGEMALLLNRSARTISRWESLLALRVERKNARVVRYPLETLIRLIAVGVRLNIAEADRIGLNSGAVIALASAVAPRPKTTMPGTARATSVFVVADEDDRRLIRAWKDPALGPVLKKIIRGLTEATSG